MLKLDLETVVIFSGFPAGVALDEKEEVSAGGLFEEGGFDAGMALDDWQEGGGLEVACRGNSSG